MSQTLYLYLGDTALGTLGIDRVRGHETWMFQYDTTYLKASAPLLDPEIANVRGPQFASRGEIKAFFQKDT